MKFSQSQDSFLQINLRQSSGDNGGCDRKLRAPGHLQLTSVPELFVGTSFPGRLLVNMGSGVSLVVPHFALLLSDGGQGAGREVSSLI